MKKLLLLTVLFSLISATVKADFGNCVVYHAKFYLKNGDVFNGCFEYSSYFEEAGLDNNNSNRFCNDKGVFDLFKKKQRGNSKVEVYKTLYYVQLRPRKQTDKWLPSYGFVFPMDMMHLDSSEISTLRFQSAEHSKREWIASKVIVGTSSVLDSIRQKRYWNSLSFCTSDEESDTIRLDYIGHHGGYILYNYNPKINVAELKRLVYLRFSPQNAAFLQKFRKKHRLKKGQEWTPKLLQLYQEAISQWFWERGILIVEFQATC